MLRRDVGCDWTLNVICKVTSLLATRRMAMWRQRGMCQRAPNSLRRYRKQLRDANGRSHRRDREDDDTVAEEDEVDGIWHREDTFVPCRHPYKPSRRRMGTKMAWWRRQSLAERHRRERYPCMAGEAPHSTRRGSGSEPGRICSLLLFDAFLMLVSLYSHLWIR